jgi:predicted NUDIX family NTP pyrophosphohydrolase
MGEVSAGMLLYRYAQGLEVFIARMGGPFWSKKDAAAWSIPKGLTEPGEDALATAVREFGEEIGAPAPAIQYERLGEFRQPSGKVIVVFVAEFADAEFVASSLFELEWPPRSGRVQQFAEMSDARWFDLASARVKLVTGQLPILDALEARL